MAPTAEQELDLVRRCAEGDDHAWSELLERYGRFIDHVVRRALGSARGRVPDVNEVADLRDEVVAWMVADDGRVLRTFRGESRLTSWLGVIVGRRARRLAQRGAGLRARTVSLDGLSAEAATHLALEGPRDEGTARQRALARLAEAVEELSERDRLLLKGAFFERRPYAELAAEVGVRTDSVGQLLYRAKQRLRKRLGGERFLENLSGCVAVGLLWLVREYLA